MTLAARFCTKHVHAFRFKKIPRRHSPHPNARSSRMPGFPNALFSRMFSPSQMTAPFRSGRPGQSPGCRSSFSDGKRRSQFRPLSVFFCQLFSAVQGSFPCISQLPDTRSFRSPCFPVRKTSPPFPAPNAHTPRMPSPTACPTSRMPAPNALSLTNGCPLSLRTFRAVSGPFLHFCVFHSVCRAFPPRRRSCHTSR